MKKKKRILRKYFCFVLLSAIVSSTCFSLVINKNSHALYYYIFVVFLGIEIIRFLHVTFFE